MMRLNKSYQIIKVNILNLMIIFSPNFKTEKNNAKKINNSHLKTQTTVTSH